VKSRPDGLLLLADPLTMSMRLRIVEFAREQKLPAIYETREFAEAGGLMSYGPNIAEQFRRSAYYVDRILKGAKPGDLPIEQPTKIDLVVNLGTARALGISIPQGYFPAPTRSLNDAAKRLHASARAPLQPRRSVR
jgi:putative ABC transport system substrate-binding protein